MSHAEAPPPINHDGETIPLSNRRATILGPAITFQILSTIAVVLRAYVRVRVIKNLGWDDILIFLAWATVLIGNTFVSLSVEVGLGKHWDTLGADTIKEYLFDFYMAYGFYSISATLVKVSLLCQYLRFFRESRMRFVCMALLVISFCWGFAYSFMALVPCFPVQAYWDWSITDATCYGYGVKAKHPFVEMFVSHAAINVLLDVAIVIAPVPYLLTKAMSKKERWSALGLAGFGVVIIWLCCWRLATIVQHEAGWSPYMDFTWRAPISIILACLEAQIAIIAVSMPIFWSVLEEQLLQIFVQNEIEITEIAQPMELENSSAKSDAGSEEGLAPTQQRQPWSPRSTRNIDQKDMFYREVIERVNPNTRGMDSSIEAGPRDIRYMNSR